MKRLTLELEVLSSVSYGMEQTERDLREEVARLNTREEYIAWEQRCDEFIESLDERSRIKHPRLSIGIRQSLVRSRDSKV